MCYLTEHPRPETHPGLLLQGALFVTALLCTAGTIQTQQAISALGYLEISSKWRFGTAALLLLPGFFWLLAILSLTHLGRGLLPAFEAGIGFVKKPGKGSWFILITSLVLFSILPIGWQPDLTQGFFTRLFFLWFLGLVGFTALRKIRPQLSWSYTFLATGLIFSASFKATSFISSITNFPLTLNWSETSNYLYSSFFLAGRFYGFSTALPFFNPGRALLGVIPFLVPVPQVWINRLWASLLWISITGLTAWALSRRLHFRNRLAPALFTLWAFLFLFQGPVYYELLLSVLPVIWLFNGRYFWRSMLVVIIASGWAGLCRINWFPMPGIVASLLYFLENPVDGTGWGRYFWKPAIWTAAGTSTAFLAFVGYNSISGNSSSTSGSALQSPLLWYRLLPSATSGIGVLVMALIVALPAFLAITFWLKKRGKSFNLWRKLAIFAILACFFAGGLVVSTKIGGGSNIHNLDAFWFLLLLVVSFFYFDRLPLDNPMAKEAIQVPALYTAALVGLPILFLLLQTQSTFFPTQNAVDDLLRQINAYVSSANQKGQEVLFIDNKQLLTFGNVPGTKMVTEYETVYMLEMAMTNNRLFFEKFRQDLKNKRFAFIFANPQPTRIQDVSESFAEENNAQIYWIGTPLLCYYQRQFTWLALGVEVFTPRPEAVDCP